jgi:hypothetical protein
MTALTTFYTLHRLSHRLRGGRRWRWSRRCTRTGRALATT